LESTHPAHVRQVIQAYGQGRFRVSGRVFEGSILLTPDSAEPWPVRRPRDITASSLDPVPADAVDILLVGCGERFGPPPKGLAEALRARGLALEWMDTGAACRTFNVLMAEDRRCAAALIAVE
jgi:uncharacterized protein